MIAGDKKMGKAVLCTQIGAVVKPKMDIEVNCNLCFYESKRLFCPNMHI